MIAPMLQMPGIRDCSSIEIEICGLSHVLCNCLPIEGISNWLEKSASDERTKMAWNEKFMEIRMSGGIQNVREMVDHLKMVYCFSRF